MLSRQLPRFAQTSRQTLLRPSTTAFTASNRYPLARTMASKQTLFEAVKEDHDEMYEYYDKYKKASGDLDAQERWAHQLRWEIARHAVGEEIVIYPLMEEKLGSEGKQLADNDRADHHLVKEFLYKLEGMKVGTEEYENTIKATMEHLHKHNDSEEREDLPQLEAVIGKAASKEAAAAFTRTKKFAPTRAHPSAPDQPPFETVVGLMSAPIDKLMDAFAKFPTEQMKQSS